jgi:preprotein translocase subunit SecY
MKAKRQIVKSALPRKVAFTSIIIFVYLLGRHIPLPLVNLGEFGVQGKGRQLIDVVSLITGGDFSQLSLFSLGLGPWMSTMIIWGFLSTSKKLNIKKMSMKVSDRWKKILMLLISIVQALGIMSFVTFQDNVLPFSRTIFVSLVSAIIITGCYVIMWLANLNIKYGIGSSSLLILVGILSSLPARLTKAINADLFFTNHLWIYGTIFAFCLISLVVTVLLERAEYRIPLERVMIHNDFAHKSYIPIKMNVAGGMSIMYGMTLLVLPQYLFSGLSMIMPKNEILRFLILNFQISKPFGLGAYLIILFFLTVGFALVNIKPDQLTETLQEMGDYIHGVNPGKDTFKFLNTKVKQIGILGGLYTVFVIGIPLIVGYIFNVDQTIASLPSMTLIIATLLFSIFDQVNMLKLNKQYEDIL